MQEIVIKISEEMWERVKDGYVPLGISKYLKNGTVLPKEHGDLIDRNDLLQESYCIDDWSGNEVNIVDTMTVEMADTIIEAERSEE